MIFESQDITYGFTGYLQKKNPDIVFGRGKQGESGMNQLVNQKKMIDKKPGKYHCLCGSRRLTKEKKCD